MFLYGELAPDRSPAFFRRGGTEELARRLGARELTPDFGPAELDERAGGAIVGARRPLIAFNVDLGGADLEVARAIAAVVRERDGGFPGVRALGLDLPRAGRVQVSMNVEDWEAAALHEIVARIEVEAEARGASVEGSELVGLMPAGAAVAAAGAQLRIAGFDASRVLELRLLAARAVSGIAIAVTAKTVEGCATTKNGATKSSPVACAPRWTREIKPITRPRTRSGTSSCAAEVRSTSAALCPLPARKPPSSASPTPSATAKQP